MVFSSKPGRKYARVSGTHAGKIMKIMKEIREKEPVR
jgi:hypothetical protein